MQYSAKIAKKTHKRAKKTLTTEVFSSFINAAPLPKMAQHDPSYESLVSQLAQQARESDDNDYLQPEEVAGEVVYGYLESGVIDFNKIMDILHNSPNVDETLLKSLAYDALVEDIKTLLGV